MSLLIDVAMVRSVLLNDGWHGVAKGSFELDTYEFVRYSAAGDDPHGNFDIEHAGGHDGICAIGFSFRDASATDGTHISGPLTAILAVRHAPSPGK